MESLLNEIMNTSISSGSDDFESMDEKWVFVVELVMMGRLPPIESVLDSVKRRADEALMNRKNGVSETEEESGMEEKRRKVEEKKGEEVSEIIDISENDESTELSSCDDSVDPLMNEKEKEEEEERGNENESKLNHQNEMNELSEIETGSSDSEIDFLVRAKPNEDQQNQRKESENERNMLDSSSDSDDKPLIELEPTSIPSHPIHQQANHISDSKSSESDNEPLVKVQSTTLQSNHPIKSNEHGLENNPLLPKPDLPHPKSNESDSSEDEPILALSSSILPLSSSVPSISPPKVIPPPPLQSTNNHPFPKDPIVLGDDIPTSSDSDDFPIVPPSSNVLKAPKSPINPRETSANPPKPSLAPLENSIVSSVTVSAVSTISAAPKPVSRDTTNTSSSNSSLLIPVFRSTLESQQHPLPNLAEEPDYPAVKPPPLSREVINELFPRSKTEKQGVEKAISRVVEKSSVVCPLCLALCEDAESLRRHINTACAMLPTPIQSSIAMNSKLNESNRIDSRRNQTPIQSPLRNRNQTPIQSPLRNKQIPVQSPVKGNQTPIQSPLRAALAPIRCPPSSTNYAMLSPLAEKAITVSNPASTATNAGTTNPNLNPNPNPNPSIASTTTTTPVQPELPSVPHSVDAIKQEVKECSSISLVTNSTINGSDLGINLEDLDLFEKELAANAESSPPICSICRDSSQDESNPLLCCQSCKVFVHASCYGLSIPPSSAWKCDVASLLSYSHR